MTPLARELAEGAGRDETREQRGHESPCPVSSCRTPLVRSHSADFGAAYEVLTSTVTHAATERTSRIARHRSGRVSERTRGSWRACRSATSAEATSMRDRRPSATDADGRALYKRRGATVEPGIGNLRKIINRFSCRGLERQQRAAPRSGSVQPPRADFGPGQLSSSSSSEPKCDGAEMDKEGGSGGAGGRPGMVRSR